MTLVGDKMKYTIYGSQDFAMESLHKKRRSAESDYSGPYDLIIKEKEYNG